MRIKFGEVKKRSGAEVVVDLGDGALTLSMPVVMPLGQGDSKAFLMPRAGDRVCVLIDEQHPEDAVCIGGVWDITEAHPSGVQVASSGELKMAIASGQVQLGEASDFVALSQKVYVELEKISGQIAIAAAAISAVAAGVPMPPPTLPSYTASSVAASHVKGS